jgi:hypothetical protein
VSKKPTPALGNLVGMGVTVGLLVGAGIGGGYWLDETFKTGLLFMLVGLGLGMAAAGAVLYFGIREFL